MIKIYTDSSIRSVNATICNLSTKVSFTYFSLIRTKLGPFFQFED